MADFAIRDIVVVTPVFNDWACLQKLLPSLDARLRERRVSARVLAVDDGSAERAPDALLAWRGEAIGQVEVLELRRNVGHQRAIAIGLCFAYERLDAAAVLVMDADGEDRPEDAVRLIDAAARAGGETVVFGERGRRSEGLFFSLFYHAYRLIFRVLTGRRIRSGNFSVIPAAALARVVAVSEIWNHFCSGLLRSRIPTRMLACDRGRRLDGRTQMSFLSLVAHGLSAIAVYADVIGIRSIVTSLIITVLAVLLAAAAVVIRLGTDLAIPGWATYVVGFAAVILLQAITLSFFFVFLVLMGRNRIGSIPLRDYEAFVLAVRRAGAANTVGSEVHAG